MKPLCAGTAGSERPAVLRGYGQLLDAFAITNAGVARGLPDHPYIRIGDRVELDIDGLGNAAQTLTEAR